MSTMMITPSSDIENLMIWSHVQDSDSEFWLDDYEVWVQNPIQTFYDCKVRVNDNLPYKDAEGGL